MKNEIEMLNALIDFLQTEKKRNNRRFGLIYYTLPELKDPEVKAYFIQNVLPIIVFYIQNDPDPNIRSQLIKSLGIRKVSEVKSLLIEIIKNDLEKDKNVKIHAAWALKSIDKQDTAKILSEKLLTISDLNFFSGIINILAEINSSTDQINLLVNFIKQKNEIKLKIEGLKELAKIDFSAALPIAVEILDKVNDKNTRTSIFKIFQEYNTSSKNILIRELKRETDPELISHILLAMGNSSDAFDFLTDIKNCLNDSQHFLVRQAAAIAIRDIALGSNDPTIVANHSHLNLLADVLLNRLKLESRPIVRIAIVKALEVLDNPHTNDFLVEILKREKHYIVFEQIISTLKLRKAKGVTLSFILDLNSENPKQKYLAALNLGKIRAHDAINELKKHLIMEENFSILTAIVVALGDLGGLDENDITSIDLSNKKTNELFPFYFSLAKKAGKTSKWFEKLQEYKEKKQLEIWQKDLVELLLEEFKEQNLTLKIKDHTKSYDDPNIKKIAGELEFIHIGKPYLSGKLIEKYLMTEKKRLISFVRKNWFIILSAIALVTAIITSVVALV